MTPGAEPTSTLWSLASTLREAVSPGAQLAIVGCLLFLRHSARGVFLAGRRTRPLSLPAEASWEQIGRITNGIASALSDVCQRLEDANPVMAGMLTAADFNEIEPWNDERRDRVLRGLIVGLSALPDVSDATQLANLYDSFITKFAESSGKRTGEMFLSPPLAHLMAELVDPTDGARICDPTCKTGRTLAACVALATERRISVAINGQELSRHLRAVCRTSLLLHGADDARIGLGDPLHSPLLDRDGRLERYPRIISAPPVHRNNWGSEDAAEDRWGRFPIIPPKNNADYAYILHALATLEEGGRAVLLTGSGVLFRQGGEAAIRRMLIQADRFEAVIGLPGGLLYGTHMPVTLIVLRKGRTARSGKVLLIDANRADKHRSRSDAPSRGEIEEISRYVRQFMAVDGVSRVVETRDIERNQWNLNPAAYIARDEVHSDFNFAEQVDAIRQLEAERDEAASRMDELIAEIGRLQEP